MVYTHLAESADEDGEHDDLPHVDLKQPPDQHGDLLRHLGHLA